MKVVVVGAGIIGACTALAAARAGCEVVLVDRDQVGSGTTSRGEGNILVSDKTPGPELDLALASRRRWGTLAEDLGAESLEFEDKGGIVVAGDPAAAEPLTALTLEQAAVGVRVEHLADPWHAEPHLTRDIARTYWYPQDAQVQPVLAAAAVVAAARRLGVEYRPHTEVAAAVSHGADRIGGVVTSTGERILADTVVNAAGTWGGTVGERLGAPVPVLPRRGFILVTEPVPAGLVRHKVYDADYVANVAASTAGLETSCVVESTRGGTILIGASRERVGFDATMDPHVVAMLAAQAVRLFPVLAGIQLMRVYRGFRPYCPDHLPVIGPDPRVSGLIHACGHEGAGIGLAPATADLVVLAATGTDHFGIGAEVDPVAFHPHRLITD